MSRTVRGEFGVSPDHLYFDAATYGLPPATTVTAYHAAVDAWQSGAATWNEGWEAAGESSRQLFARLIGAAPETISLQPSVSAGMGMVAASVPLGSVVLAADDEFTSAILPFVGAGRITNATIRTVPWERLIDSITAETDVVVVSLTRAQDGRTVDLGELIRAASHHDVRVIIDGTHAIPFVQVAKHLDGIDYLIAHGYKHLLCPRGAAFAYINPRFMSSLAPINANWRSVDRAYGLDLGPIETAAFFDISLAWHAWIGAKASLERLVAWNEDGTLQSSLDFAKQLARGLEIPEPKASLVCVPVRDPEAIATTLDQHGLRAAGRGDYLRLSTHVWNTTGEVDRAIALVNQLLDETGARV